VSIIAMASVLMVLQCYNHMCLCENTAEDDENDLMVEVEEEMAEVVDIFQPTHEWKTVEEGQAIPPGLHIRMNMQTGAKEAKLMSDSSLEEATDSMNEKRKDEARDTRTPQSQPTEPVASDNGGESPHIHPGFIFQGDQRRAHYYGHSDRRGIVNKRRRVFSQREVAEALKKMDESEVDLANLPGIAYSEPESGKSPHSMTAANSGRSGDITIVQHDREPRIEQAMHPDLSQMMQHAKTLTRQTATVSELLHALEELEYHVHHFENAKELNSIGGLVVVVRLLNHTNPEVRSSAAHVIGAAVQSNPQVQAEALGYGALELLCRFIAAEEPDLVQRRGLFALSALVRGKTQPQLVFVQQCRGLWQLGHNFHQRTMATQLKIITLLTDLLHEQEELLHNSDELKTLLHTSVLEHGWCQHVPSLLHIDTPSPTEKALQAMSVLQHLCDFTGHLSRLQELNSQFEEALHQEEDEVSLVLLKHSQDLLKNIRNRNKEL
jgi:nucleotide exchange factor SIL1